MGLCVIILLTLADSAYQHPEKDFSMKEGGLSNSDHDIMDDFLGRVLDAYKSGDISRETAISGLAHVMAALDKGNTGGAVSWFNQEGVSFFKETA